MSRSFAFPRAVALPRTMSLARGLRPAAFAALLLGSTALSATAAEVFNRVATFHVIDNLPADGDPANETVAEIITATPDGMTLVYSDALGERVGIIGLADPMAPTAGGAVALGGSPTSVVATGPTTALVGVVTSESKANPSGHVATIDLAGKTVTATCDLGGQPDSLAVSPDGAFLAIVIENERDEEVNDGAIPQLPSGNLTVFRLTDGALDCASRTVVDLTGLSAIAPDDAEPELVDINTDNLAVVTLQENNHIALVDLATAAVTAHFTAGTVNLEAIDTQRNGIIQLSGSVTDRLREPDGVHWLDNDRFATANEGDLDGGTRSFSIFAKDGTVLFESGAALDHLAVRLGHYPESRNSKGNEPEGVTAAMFGGEPLIFVGSERSSLVSVYRDTGAEPEYLQALPGGIGPEGLLAIPGRNLFVTASENDLRADGLIGSVVTIYARAEGTAAYPTIMSADDADGLPIAWTALSGAVGDPAVAGKLYVVSDSVGAEGRIFTVDATQTPAVITASVTVTRDGAPATLLDLEGIAMASDGGFWLASEGNPERAENKTWSTLLKVSADGAIEQEIALPEAIAAASTRYGFEGVTVSGTGADETVWIAVQREWADDAKGMVKLLAYKPADGGWGVVHYPLDVVETGWIGLSDLTAVPGGLVAIERDNQVGRNAQAKGLTFVSLAGITPAAPGATDIPVLTKTWVQDLLPMLAAPGGYVLDKVESFAIDAAGDAFVITDNDGVSDHNGETQFLRLGRLALPN